MDVIFSVGLEMGSYNSDCWLYVFRYVIGFRLVSYAVYSVFKMSICGSFVGFLRLG